MINIINKEEAVRFGLLEITAALGKKYNDEQIQQLAKAALEAIEALGNAKEDKVKAASVIIPTTGWKQNSANTQYPYYYDIAVEGVTPADLAVVILPDSTDKLGIEQINDTISNAVRIQAKATPSSVISAVIWILGGSV